MAGETGLSILSYRGDAALGLAANAGALAGSGEISTEGIAQAGREVALQSFAANKILYEQAIADRNAAFKMIDDDKLVLDNVPEEHRARLEEQKNKIYAIWDKYNGDIYSDPARYREFQKAIAETKQSINQSHKWYTWLTAEQEAMKNDTNPVAQAKRAEFVQKQWADNKNNFWALPKPYAPVTDFSPENVAFSAMKLAPVTKQDGEYDITTTKVDTVGTMNAYQKKWADPKFNHEFTNYIFGQEGKYGGFLGGPNAASDITRVNERLEALNNRLGLKEGDLGYVTPLGVREDPNNPGRFVAAGDRADQIAAKIALADAEPLVEDRKYNEDRARVNVTRRGQDIDLQIAKMKDRIDWAALNLEKDKAMTAVKGPESIKNAAWEFARQRYQEIANLGELWNAKKDEQGNVIPGTGFTVVEPDQLRKLTNVHFRYMGKEEVDKEGRNALRDLKLNKGEALVLDHATNEVRVMKKFKKITKDGKRAVVGEFDPTRSTSITGIFTNKVNEEVVKAAGKEVGVYEPGDSGRGGGADIGTPGSTTTTATSTSAYKFKTQYKVPGTNSVYTLDQLRKMYSDEQIIDAINLGNLN